MLKAICTEPEILHLKSTRPFFLVENLDITVSEYEAFPPPLGVSAPFIRKFLLEGSLFIQAGLSQPPM